MPYMGIHIFFSTSCVLDKDTPYKAFHMNFDIVYYSDCYNNYV